VSELILLSTSNEEKAAPYVAALAAVGVPADRVRVLTPEADALAPAEFRALAARAAGLVLAGGADVHPGRYGEATRPDAGVEVDERRDEMEWALLDGAREAGVPVWAVCRGMQVVNVYLGGTLWQDLPTQKSSSPVDHDPDPDGPKDALVHEVTPFDGATGLGAALAGHPLRVNSRHHQAVKDLAPGLVAVAAAPDGLVEACELPAHPSGESGWWLRAVQWHPENLVALPDQPAQRALWGAFAAAAGVAVAVGTAR
jgi:putative glutamine amidotransferase